ncbi:RNA polymerase sigma factor [Sporosarcina sp. Te-1]|uniref:RNA polymerase sigma factor n=1 Tax=Sporosarcina sp. Te-1 TaxID=2818390 RepID=UPI001A9EC9C4|nr:sigma-70 family RNA polymerase sigma factor [Sporosarcina sp. Te-1]QTD42682.1 sigma-70 family RNA polymerase sigma factor [Sporosarcina sp. Te-1]
MDESELIAKAQEGDQAAYGELMTKYYRTVEKFAFQCGVRLDDIGDVTQEVFIKLYRFLPQFNQQRFTTWLYKITLNATRDYYRKEGREKLKRERFVINRFDSSEPSAEDQVFLFEEDRELHEAMIRLDEKYRIPLILFYFQDISYQQIADILNMTMPAVKTRIFRAKELLKKEISLQSGGASNGQ